MIIPDGVRPRLGDRREFLHKKILGGISRLAGLVPIPGAQLVSRVTGALAGQPRTTTTTLAPRRTVSRFETARITRFSQAEKNLGRELKFQASTDRFERPRAMTLARTSVIPPIEIPGFLPCLPPAKRDQFGKCILGDRPGRDLPGGFDVGEAVMGQYGAGLVPGSMPIDRAVCLKGMQLGNDGVCYNKAQITNKQRMWPAGRRPLLSGGDMRAIGIAARAGRRLEGATKRLQKMGMMKKPARRGRPLTTRHQALLEAHAGTSH